MIYIGGDKEEHMKKAFLMISVVILLIVAGCAKQEDVVQAPPASQDQKTEGPIINKPEVNEETKKNTEAVKEFSVEIAHTSYKPNIFKVSVGDKVKFKAIAAQGTSSHNHGITIDEFNVNKAVTTEDASNPVIIEFVADKKGRFLIYCKTCEEGQFGKSHPKITATLNVE